MKKVFFYYADRFLKIKNKKVIQAFITTIFKEEGVKLARLNYIFCSDSYLLKINQSFLEHNFYTDIITFDLSDTNKEVVSEIYISLDRVRENSLKLAIPFENEVYRVLFHGVLHLCGYKDKKKIDVQTMRKKEDYYLRRFRENLFHVKPFTN